MEPNTDRPRVKNLIGMFLLIFGLTLYAFLAAGVGNLLAGTWLAVQIVYYLIAGIVWILPAKWLLDWMAPKDPSSPGLTKD